MSDETSELVVLYSKHNRGNNHHPSAQAEKALNAVQGKDHVTKWKRKVVDGLAPLREPRNICSTSPRSGWKQPTLSGTSSMN